MTRITRSDCQSGTPVPDWHEHTGGDERCSVPAGWGQVVFAPLMMSLSFSVGEAYSQD